MTMTRLALSFVGVIAVGGIAASLVIRHGEQVRLREQAEAWRQQAEQLAQASAENERLSNLVARSASPQALSPDRLRELLRLRGQVGLLRQVAGEQAELQATNQRLRAGMAVSEEELAAARAAPNFWAKEQLAFAGYAEPEATLKTMLWAMSNGDAKAHMACCVSGPEAVARLEKELGEKAAAEVAAEGKRLAESMAPSIGFHIVDKKVNSADEVALKLSFDGEGKTRWFVMQRVASEWKMADMLWPGVGEP